MVININIHDSIKNYHVTMFLIKININTFDVLIFIQMRADQKRKWKWMRTGKKGF